MLKKIFLNIALSIFSLNLMAQTPVNDVEMADVMRTNGKIYVVVAVVAIVLAGFIVYLINVDRKLSKLEKELDEREKLN